jgi:hypothetical protein
MFWVGIQNWNLNGIVQDGIKVLCSNGQPQSAGLARPGWLKGKITPPVCGAAVVVRQTVIPAIRSHLASDFRDWASDIGVWVPAGKSH